jgi:hypothetical protein
MALEALDGTSVRRYSSSGRRSLITMVARRALRRVNGPASHVLMKPFVVMAARVLGPGPIRLKLVKLAHNLSSAEPGVLALPDDAVAAQPTQRAA